MNRMRIMGGWLLLIGGCGGAWGQQVGVPGNEAAGLAAMSVGRVRADLAYVSSDQLQGRMSLEAGDNAVVQWIAKSFARAGLKPLGLENGRPSFLQPMELVEFQPDRGESSVTMTRAGVKTVWKAPMALGTYKHAVDLTAPVVFAGYGITAPELGYDDYAGTDVRGKIVVVFDHEPQEDDPRSIFNGTGNTRYATSRVKLLNAQAHGAVAVVLAPEPNRKHLTNAERVARIAASKSGPVTTRTVPLPLQAIADDELHIPSVSIVDDVTWALFGSAGRQGASVIQAKIDADLKPQSYAMPDTMLTLHLSNLTENKGVTNNVAGLLEGSDPTLRAETIIISAHHDHDGAAPCAAGEGGVNALGQPIATGPDCMAIWHGADDNGSGTVGVVELSRAFAANGVKPKRSVLFVVFAGEERGLLGSYYMAQHPLRPLATTRAMINFDMIGRDEKPSPQTDGLIAIPADTSERLNLIGALYSPQYDAVVKQENAHVGLVLDDRFDHESALNVFFRSDQFPFVLKNVPAFWWFTGFHPDYHHITDTAEKIDYAKMMKILDLAYLSAWRFANDATTPAFIANPMPAGAAPKKAH